MCGGTGIVNRTKIIIVIATVAVLITGVYIFLHLDQFDFSTVKQEEAKDVANVDELEVNHFYIWHNPGNVELKDVINKKDNEFIILPEADINWSENEDVAHTIWFTSENDSTIPTFYAGDELIYISDTNIPFEGINWERFAEEGYTIGVSNLVADKSDHFHIPYDDKEGYEGYLYANSDGNQVSELTNVTNLFLDKVGDSLVRSNTVTDGGTVKGLKKDKSYICTFYTGSFYQDYRMTANVHAFGHLEEFTTYYYNFLHSNCITIEIPTWFKSGYYYVNGIGFFRYVSAADQMIYNGKPYDDAVNWNEPIILRDENGIVIYDPSQNIDERYTEKEESFDEIESDSGWIEDEVEEDDDESDTE